MNALETLNIRGERSVTCKGEFDSIRRTGPLPEARRPRAKNSASSRTRSSARRSSTRSTARNPDLEALPMYCVTFAWKNWYDAKDMRATGGNDVNFAMDVPEDGFAGRRELRAKGAISLRASRRAAKAAAGADGAATSRNRVMPHGNLAYGAWGGQPCNPYDTAARAARLERRLGRRGQREPRGLLDLRADRRVPARVRRRATASSIC